MFSCHQKIGMFDCSMVWIKRYPSPEAKPSIAGAGVQLRTPVPRAWQMLGCNFSWLEIASGNLLHMENDHRNSGFVH